MMEVRALMDSGLIPSRSRRSGSSRGSIDGGNADPVANERARQHAERASASVSGTGARHYRRRSATSDVAEPAAVVPRQRTVSEEGVYLERGRSAENGGIPAAATLAGLQRISPQPTGSPKRGRADPSPRASPPTTPSRVPSGTYAPAAAQRQASPRSPLTYGAGASPRSAGGRMSPLSLSPSQSVESDIGRKAASAWTSAVDTLNTGRRTAGGNPRAVHMGGAGGSSTSLTDSAASGQLDAQSGRSTPDGLLGGAPSAADELQVCMHRVRLSSWLHVLPLGCCRLQVNTLWYTLYVPLLLVATPQNPGIDELACAKFISLMSATGATAKGATAAAGGRARGAKAGRRGDAVPGRQHGGGGRLRAQGQAAAAHRLYGDHAAPGERVIWQKLHLICCVGWMAIPALLPQRVGCMLLSGSHRTSDLSVSSLERAPPASQAGWPEARWDVLLAAVQEWREVADMADKQQGWQVLEGFPLSDEAVRLGASHVVGDRCSE